MRTLIALIVSVAILIALVTAVYTLIIKPINTLVEQRTQNIDRVFEQSQEAR
jgi:F0F1-type ATP synthase membrane subunit b/b'